MKKLLCLLLLCGSALAQQSTLRTLSIPGPVPGSATAGIQAMVNSLPISSGLYTAPSGGGAIQMGRGVYNYSSQITLPNTALFPIDITFQGAGYLNTIWRHIGTTAFDGIVTAYNPSFGSTNTLTVTFNDIGFTCSSNFVLYLLNLGGVSYAHFNRCMFAPDAALTYNPAGWTANIHENGLTNVQGVAAVRLQSAQNPGVFFNECVFLGLASGVRSAMDNIQFTRCVAVDIGGFWNGSSFVFTNLWTTSPESLGAAFIDEGSSGDFYVTDCQIGNAAAGVAEVSSAAGLEGHVPQIKGGYFGDNQYTVLTYDRRPISVDSVFEGTSGGDSLITNNAAGRAFAAGITPNNVYRFNRTGNYMSLGTNVFKATMLGDMTNWGRASFLNGAAVFNATVTVSTNWIHVSGAGDSVLNGYFYPTNVPASVCADANSLMLTNTVTRAYILYDPLEGCISVDDWEWRNVAGSVLVVGSPYGSIGGISVNPGVGTAPAPQTVFVNTSMSQSSPGLSLSGTITANASTLTNEWRKETFFGSAVTNGAVTVGTYFHANLYGRSAPWAVQNYTNGVMAMLPRYGYLSNLTVGVGTPFAGTTNIVFCIKTNYIGASGAYLGLGDSALKATLRGSVSTPTYTNLTGVGMAITADSVGVMEIVPSAALQVTTNFWWSFEHWYQDH